MKTSISSYSFSHIMRENLENQLSVIKKAKKLGVDTIEFTTLTPHNNSSDAEYALKACTEFI